MKLDTIEKHVGKVYDKKVANDEKKYTPIQKSHSQCQHLQFEEEYSKFLLNKKKIEESGGTITSQFAKMMKNKFVIKYNTIKHYISPPIQWSSYEILS